jgi:hypothetical protein
VSCRRRPDPTHEVPAQPGHANAVQFNNLSMQSHGIAAVVQARPVLVRVRIVIAVDEGNHHTRKLPSQRRQDLPKAPSVDLHIAQEDQPAGELSGLLGVCNGSANVAELPVHIAQEPEFSQAVCVFLVKR